MSSEVGISSINHAKHLADTISALDDDAKVRQTFIPTKSFSIASLVIAICLEGSGRYITFALSFMNMVPAGHVNGIDPLLSMPNHMQHRGRQLNDLACKGRGSWC